MNHPAPRHLDDADQRFSDRAVAAATQANSDQRIAAHSVANRLAEESPEPRTALEVYAYYSAYLCISLETEGRFTEEDVRRVARDIKGVHFRHLEAIERKAAG